MKRIIKQHTTLLFFLIAVMLTPAAFCQAADVTLIPSISLREEFDDNVYYTRGSEKIEDMVTQISPAFTLDYDTELLNIRSKAAMDILKYVDEDNLDTEYYRCEADGSYNMLERTTLTGNFSYIKDTTLESELTETGLAEERQDRTRYDGGMGINYRLDQVSTMGMNYSHSKTSYELPRFADYDIDFISLFYSHPFNNQLDLLTIQSYFQKYKTKTAYNAPIYYSSKTDNYGLTFKWLHVFNETLTLSSTLGTRYTESEYHRAYLWFFKYPAQKDSSWAGVADIKLDKTGETYSASVGYNRDLSYSSTGEPINRDKFSIDANRRLTERFTIKFHGNLYFTKSDDAISDRDERYYHLSPSLTYKITENHSFSLNYVYSNSYDKNLSTDQKLDRNRVWISLNFRFPKKW